MARWRDENDVHRELAERKKRWAEPIAFRVYRDGGI